MTAIPVMAGIPVAVIPGIPAPGTGSGSIIMDTDTTTPCAANMYKSGLQITHHAANG